MSSMQPQEDAVERTAASRSMSVKRLAMRFEVLMRPDEQPRTGRTAPGEPPPPPPPTPISVMYQSAEVIPVPHSVHVPTRSSSSVSSASSDSPSPSGQQRSSTLSPPPPISTLPSRNNSRVQGVLPSPSGYQSSMHSWSSHVPKAQPMSPPSTICQSAESDPVPHKARLVARASSSVSSASSDSPVPWGQQRSSTLSPPPPISTLPSRNNSRVQGVLPSPSGYQSSMHSWSSHVPKAQPMSPPSTICQSAESDPVPHKARLAARASSSVSSASSSSSSPWPLPGLIRATKPPSSLPSRNNSRVQDARPLPLPSTSSSNEDDYEHIYETLKGSVEMETFANEPLYQIYSHNADELAREYISREFESCSSRRTAPDAVPLSASDGGAPRGQFRTLWCQLPEVRSGHVLETLSAEERKLMEAKFEIITSEASYINSLNILKNHFMDHLQQCEEADFGKEDRRIVFGEIVAVRNVAEKMLSQLESCRKKDVFMRGMLQAIHDIARSDFKIYVDYCAYQNCRTRTLERLRTRRVEPTSLGEIALEEVSYRLSFLWNQANSRYQQPGTFAQTLAALEAHPVCQGLTLQSFLLVPMQRITKLQLLLGAVLNCMDWVDEEYDICKMALQQISDVVRECNEGVRSVERMEELLSLSKQFTFDRGVKMLPLYSSNRWLVKKGKVIELNPEWFTAKAIYIFIFNDILFLAKKRKLFPQHVERFLVVDYCNREDVRLMNTEGTLHLPERLSSGFCMLLTLLKNHREKKVSKLIYFACESDRQRWTDAMNPPDLVKEPKEWPQVVVKWPYTAEQPDELSIQVSDIINVFTKSADGWYQGQRLRDDEMGWFPGDYTVDIEPLQLRGGTVRKVVMAIYYV